MGLFNNYVGMRVQIDTSGFKDIVKLSESRSITLKGVRAGIKILQKPAKSLAPRRVGSGALRQAQGTKAKKGKKGRTLSFAIQGAKTGFSKMVKPRGYKKSGRTRGGKRRWSGGYKTPQKAVPAFYDHLVQGGTQPHRLGKGQSMRRRGKIGRAIQQLRVLRDLARGAPGIHPGTKKNPYRKRAYQSVKAEVGAAVNKAMGDELQRIIAKNAAKLNAVK